MEPSAGLTTLHLTNAWHATSGGVRTFYLAAIDAANRLGRRFRLVVPAERTSVEDAGPSVRIYRVAAPRAPIVDSRYRLLLPHAYLTRGSILHRILAAERPELVEITDEYTLPWLAGLVRKGRVRGAGRPVLVGLSCERMDDNVETHAIAGQRGRRLARRYMRRLYVPLFDYHVAASEYVAAELRDAAPPERQACIAVRTPGVDFQRFRPDLRSPALRDELLGSAAQEPSALLLLYAGRLAREKNVSLLVELMARLENRACRLVVAGSGPLRNRLESEASAHAPGRIRFLPHVTDRERLAALYASSDAFVHPNPREPFGIAPLEAMASGCPLVAPRAGGVLTYASDENAWLAEPTGRALAGAVEALSSRAEERARRAARARDTAAQYDWPLVMARMFEHYDALHADFHRRHAPGAR